MSSYEQLQDENALLLERLESAERYTAQTLARATRLSQVISVLGHDIDFDTVVERAAIEVAELFSADVAVLALGPDAALKVEGQWGVRRADIPEGPFPIAGLEGLTALAPVVTGPAETVPVPRWLERYAPATSPGSGCSSATSRSGCCCSPAAPPSPSSGPRRRSCRPSPIASPWRWRTACCTGA